MRKTLVFFCMFVVVSTIVAQQATQPANRSPLEIRRLGLPREGRITIHPHPAEEVVSLDQLMLMSTLIVEGTVLSSFPPIRVNPEDIYNIETHSLVEVSSILTGEVPGESPKIILAQRGGTIDRLEVVAPDAPLVQPGERYLLFLARDEREKLKNTTSLERYYVVGVWAGLLTIKDGKVLMPSRSENQFHQYNHMDIKAFVKVLGDKIHRRNLPAQQNSTPHPRAASEKIRQP